MFLCYHGTTVLEDRNNGSSLLDATCSYVQQKRLLVIIMMSGVAHGCCSLRHAVCSGWLKAVFTVSDAFVLRSAGLDALVRPGH